MTYAMSTKRDWRMSDYDCNVKGASFVLNNVYFMPKTYIDPINSLEKCYFLRIYYVSILFNKQTIVKVILSKTYFAVTGMTRTMAKYTTYISR